MKIGKSINTGNHTKNTKNGKRNGSWRGKTKGVGEKLQYMEKNLGAH